MCTLMEFTAANRSSSSRIYVSHREFSIFKRVGKLEVIREIILNEIGVPAK